MYVLMYGGPTKNAKPGKSTAIVQCVAELPPTVHYDGKTFTVSPDVAQKVNEEGLYDWDDTAAGWGVRIIKEGTWQV